MKLVRVISVFFLVVMFIMSCDNDNSTSPGDIDQDGETGILTVLLTDAPADYDSVNVTFSEVSVHYDGETENVETEEPTGEWVVLSNEIQTFNLLDLSNGATALLGEAEMSAGHYTQMRLVIDDAEIVIGDEIIPLTIPSGTLKFVSGFDVVADAETEMIVDFDAARSIHITGNDNYKMKPTIRIINSALTGGIKGTVINPDNVPTAYAIAGVDTVTSSYINMDNGKFTLGFLPPGVYTVAITDTLGAGYENAGVAVTAGSKFDLGEITLE